MSPDRKLLCWAVWCLALRGHVRWVHALPLISSVGRAR
jgi:hypothetical protein